MAKNQSLIAALLISALLGGCTLPSAAKRPTGVGTGVQREGVVRAKLPGNIAKPAAVTAATTATPAGVISNNGAGVISNNAGSLSGIVRAPASLISNNGGGIISNNSGGYRVRRYSVRSTANEVALANVQVTLLDAEGKQLLGEDGKPLVTKTNEKGQYSFKGLLPGNNLLVAVVLPDAKGTLKAIAPKGGGDGRKADVNLISTLTTGYILDQYVKGQTDPQKTLDKLPGSIESETRAKAALAFNESGESVPATLSDANVVQTVTAMRQKSEVFDAQMETVKKLLIAAGQSDLGSGRNALEVTFREIGGLMIGANGHLHISSPWERRLWRLDAAGKLQTAAGKGVASMTSPNGLAGADAGLAYFASVSMDAQGRALILEDSLYYEDNAFPDAGRLTRLGADGKLTELWARIPGAIAALPGAGDEALVLVANYADDENYTASYELHAVSAGAAAVKKATFAQGDSELLESAMGLASDGLGGIYLLAYVYNEATETDMQALYKLAPGATTLSKVTEFSDDVWPVLDSHGNIFLMDYDTHTITVRKPDGTTSTVLAQMPVENANLDAAVLGADGTAYVSLDAKIYKVTNGTATAVAGTGTGQVAGQATTVAVAPSGMAIAASGEIFFTDADGESVFRIDTNQQIKPYAGPEGLAVQKAFDWAGAVQTDASGNVYIADWEKIHKVDGAGVLTTIYAAPDTDYSIDNFVVSPNGHIYASVTSEASQLLHIAPGLAPVELKKDPDGYGFSLAATNVALYVAATTYESEEDEVGVSQLSRWTAAGGFEVLKTDPRFDTGASMAVDGRGRLYLTGDYGKQVLRFDVAAGTFKTIAGKGGTHFNGGTVDTSLDAADFPCFDKDGNLFIADIGHSQIKRIPANEL